MSETGRNILVGLTTIAALAGLIALLLLFGEIEHVVRPRYALTINTDHASGLRRGSSVEHNGVPIGVIDAVEIHAEAKLPVRVVANIDSTVSIPAAAVPYATSSLLGGSAVLELDAPPGAIDAGRLARNGSATIEGPIRFRMIEQITTELDSRMAPLVRAFEKFEALSDTYREFGERLNAFLDEPAVDDGQGGPGGDRGPNLRSLLQSVEDVMVDARAAIGLARDWLGDEQLRTNANEAVRKASILMDDAAGTIERFAGLAESLELDADTVSQRLLPVADEAARTIEAVRRLTTLAAEGDGTVAMLLNDPGLYLSLNDAAQRLERAARAIELVAEKFRKEGVPIGF